MSATEVSEMLRDGTVTVAGVTREFGLGRSKVYELMGRGELPYTQVGTRRLIPRAAIRMFLARHFHGGRAAVA